MQLHLFVMESERGGVVSRIEILFFMGINFYNDSVETFSMIPSHISNLTSCFPFPFPNLWVLDKLERKRILVQFRMSKNLNAFHIFSYHWFLFFFLEFTSNFFSPTILDFHPSRGLSDVIIHMWLSIYLKESTLDTLNVEMLVFLC